MCFCDSLLVSETECVDQGSLPVALYSSHLLCLWDWNAEGLEDYWKTTSYSSGYVRSPKEVEFFYQWWNVEVATAGAAVG